MVETTFKGGEYMRIFISQPMRDKTAQEIEDEQNEISEFLTKKYGEKIDLEFAPIITQLHDIDFDNVSDCLVWLSSSCWSLSVADAAYFTDDWDMYKINQIEHAICRTFGIEIIHD